MPFAQLIIGPPGSGKSTYCAGMQQFLSALGRKCSVVNLDPANDLGTFPLSLSSSADGAAVTVGQHASARPRGGHGVGAVGYDCALDVREVVRVEEVMEEQGLGPNGAVLWALEELEGEGGGEWLERGLRGLGDDYVLFDCPGQVELFTHHGSLRRIFARIEKMGYRLVVLHLTDSYTLTLPSLYISTVLLSLRAMLQMDLPHLNVLTKIDKLASYAPLPFNLDYYTEVQDLSYLLPHLASENPAMQDGKFAGLNHAIVELVEDFGLVGFETLAVEDKRSMMTLLQAIDRAGGYAFGGAEGANDTVWQVAMREGLGQLSVGDVQERWIDRKDEFDELERRELEEAARARGTPDLTDYADDDEDEYGMDGMARRIADSGVTVVRRP